MEEAGDGEDASATEDVVAVADDNDESDLDMQIEDAGDDVDE